MTDEEDKQGKLEVNVSNMNQYAYSPYHHLHVPYVTQKENLSI